RLTLGRALGRGEKLFRLLVILVRIGDVDHLQCPARDQRVEGEFGVKCLVPRAHTTAHDSAHGKRGVEAARVLLHQSGGDHAPERVSPGDGRGRISNISLKNAEGCDLIGNRLLHRPAGRSVRGSRQRISRAEQVSAGEWIAYILRRIRSARFDISVTIKKKSAVPWRRDVDYIGGAVRQGAGDVLLGRRASAEHSDHKREYTQERELGDLRHGNLPFLQE